MKTGEKILCGMLGGSLCAGAAAAHLRLLDVMNALMSETNPIPVKAACARMGYGKNEVRLPLVPMEEEKTARLMQMIEEARVQ